MRTLGIIGGMGPFATLDFFKKVLDASDVECDQKHLHIFIDNYPQIPDRTTFLLKGGENPYPLILESAKNLIMLNCSVLCMPCNTAHYWAEQLKRDISGDAIFIDMIESVKEYIFLKYGNKVKALIMGTDGLVKSKIYDKYFDSSILIYPDNSLQNEVMTIIKLIKAGKTTDIIDVFKELLAKLKKYKPDLLIAACTEIPIILPFINSDVEILDSNLILAQKVVEVAYERI
jgi:aspartate racemase